MNLLIWSSNSQGRSDETVSLETSPSKVAELQIGEYRRRSFYLDPSPFLETPRAPKVVEGGWECSPVLLLPSVLP